MLSIEKETQLMYSIFLQKQNAALINLKLWICSGETLVASLAEEFFKYFPENEHKLCNFYGSTEIMGDVTYHIISSLKELKQLEKVPIGNIYFFVPKQTKFFKTTHF